MRTRSLALHSPPFAPCADGVLPWRRGLAYGALGLPLAFVSLPLYVSLPHHYAAQAGVPLAVLGATLLGVRALDAVVDPWLGRWADARLQAGSSGAWRAAAALALLLACAFALLWQPPQGDWQQALVWLIVSLIACTGAYSALSLLHQSWGTRWGGTPAWRAQVSAWREGAALVGVLLASVLPWWLGLPATSLALALCLVLGLAGLRALVPGERAVALLPVLASASPWQQAGFRRLVAVYLLNGTASAIPATLLPFFVSDRLAAPDMQALLLLTYFGAGALGLPAWTALAGRWGLSPTWRLGMLVSVLSFAVVPSLGAGDTTAFLLVCLCSGLALGADLVVPGALLTGVIQQTRSGPGREGQFLGWWTCVGKLNLALAAGLALPLLAWWGYRAGSTDAAALTRLAWAYGGLPCALKLCALALLWRFESAHPEWKDST